MNIFIMYQFEIGGVESVFRELCKCYNQPIKLVTITPQYNTNLIDLLPTNVEYVKHDNIPILRNLLWLFNHKAKALYILLSLLILPIFLRLRNGNIKIINFSDTLSSLFVTVLATKKRHRYSWVHCRPQALWGSKMPKVYVRLLSLCKSIVCICHDQKKELLSLFPILSKNNVEVIYNPIDLDTIVNMAQEPLPVLAEMPYICMVSRIDERSKDFKTPIKAYASLPKEIRDIYTLQIVGDGPDIDRVKEYIIEYQMEDYVKLRGRDINPYRWMYNADLFLFSSKSEGLGLVILEALACGQMVIATDCPIGPKEILQSDIECGILVNVGDASQMRDAIIKAINPQFPRYKYQENAVKRLRYFSHDAFKEQIDNIFN